LQPKDETWIIDPLPYVGDRALGTFQFIKSGAAENKGTFSHLVAKLQGAGNAAVYLKATTFTEQRVRTRLTKEWLARTLVLHEDQVSSTGAHAEVPLYPVEATPQPTEAQLEVVPGALAAYRGLAGLRLQACGLNGSKVRILPSRLAELQGAPLEVQDALDRLKAIHEQDYQDLLGHMGGSSKEDNANEEGDPDSRFPSREDPGPAELIEYESEEQLKSQTTINLECKSGAIHLLRDNKDMVYLVARADDCTLAIGTHLGGVGGGNVLPADPDSKRCFPWSFPQGDKTWTQLTRAPTEGEEVTSKAPKFTGGTLYAIVRELEANAASAPCMTSFGQLTPLGSAGRHQYTFEFPEGHDHHQAMAWVPTAPGTAHLPTNKQQSRHGQHTHIATHTHTPQPRPGTKEPKNQPGNFFYSLLHRDTGVGQGPLQVIWRVNHDAVGNLLKPAKPQVVVGKRIVLKKGCPVKAAWP
jgi:hypothetical protein